MEQVGDLETSRVEQLTQAFQQQYGEAPTMVVRAPGRINLIGEHTDYNGGHVLPLAIDRTMLIAAKPKTENSNKQVNTYSLDLERSGSFDPEKIEKFTDNAQKWLNYLQGTIWALEQRGLLQTQAVPSVNLAITGNVPQGAGLSSSAALETATGLLAFLLAGHSEAEIDRVALALACQYAENKFIGANTGIMDQFISALGQTDSALLINTRTLDYRAIPLGFEKLGLKIVAVDSAVPHSHATGGYNKVRSEAEEALRLLKPLLNLPDNAELGDITPEQFATVEDKLPEINRKRARHAITENARVLQAVQLLENGFQHSGDLARFGELINQSHFSLRDDYEVSAPQVDLLVDLAQKLDGVIGARITGGGFGGCTVNIVEEKALPAFEEKVFQVYREKTGLDAKMYVCRSVAGASRLQ